MNLVHLSVYRCGREKPLIPPYSFITSLKDDTPCPTDVLRSGKSEGKKVVKMTGYDFRTKDNDLTLEVYLIEFSNYS